jgi:hypothetical protein
MNKFAIPAVAVAALLAVPAIAADQPRDQQAQPTAQQQQQMQQEGVGQRQPQAGEHELINMQVVDQQGEDLGEIQNVLVDEQGQVKAVIIQHGAVMGVGGQQVAVPYDRLQMPEARPGMAQDERQARIDMTEEQLGELPEYEGHDNGAMQRDQRDQPRTQQPGAQPGQPGQPGTQQQPGQQR